MHAVRREASKGAVLDADKLTKDSWMTLGCRSLGSYRAASPCVYIIAHAALLHRGGGATFSKTLTYCAVLSAHPPSYCLGGAAAADRVLYRHVYRRVCALAYSGYVRHPLHDINRSSEENNLSTQI